MVTTSNKVPPHLNTFKSYNDWIRIVNLWTKFTNLDKEKRDGCSYVTLQKRSGSNPQSIRWWYSKLGWSKTYSRKFYTIYYKKHELQQRFQDLENFESNKRAPETSIQELLIEFDQRYCKPRRHQTIISKDLGFKLLKSANLKVTVINYENVNSKIKPMFSCEFENTAQNPEIKIKNDNYFTLKRSPQKKKRNMETMALKAKIK